MVAARMSGSMGETPRKSVGLGVDSRHVISFPFLSNLVSCTGEHLATQFANILSGKISGYTVCPFMMSLYMYL